MTLTVMVQLPFEGMTPPFNWIPAEPTIRAAPRLLSSEPPQLLLVVRSASVMAPGVMGKVSVNVAPVSATRLLLASTICKVDTPVFDRIGLVRNDLVMVGRVSTARLALTPVASSPPLKPLILVVVLV